MATGTDFTKYVTTSKITEVKLIRAVESTYTWIHDTYPELLLSLGAEDSVVQYLG
jgi:hypothetical protein